MQFRLGGAMVLLQSYVTGNGNGSVGVTVSRPHRMVETPLSLRSGRTRTRARPGSGPRARSKPSGAPVPTGRVRPDGPRSGFQLSGHVDALPWGTSFQNVS